MMQTDYPVRIEQNIATTLIDIPGRGDWFMTMQHFLQVSLPAAYPPYVPERCGQHAVTAVERARFVNQYRPFQAGIFNIAGRQKAIFKGDNSHFDPETVKFFLMITQLRDVSAAWQSAKMAMKHQQQPVPLVLVKGVNASETVC